METAPTPLRDAIAFWETRRLAYNLAIAAVLLAFVAAYWPRFREAFDAEAWTFLAVYALAANACYSLGYLVDLGLQYAPSWKRWRPLLWATGTLFAVLLTWYWMGDEIVPALA